MLALLFRCRSLKPFRLMSFCSEAAGPSSRFGSFSSHHRRPPQVVLQTGQLLRRIVKRFRGGLVLKAHGLLYHPTLGSLVINRKKKARSRSQLKEVSESRNVAAIAFIGLDFYLYFPFAEPFTPVLPPVILFWIELNGFTQLNQIFEFHPPTYHP